MIKVLITYVSAGAGHKKAAEAVYEYLVKARPDLEVKIIDILDYTSVFFKAVYSTGYIFVVSKLPWLWYFFYCLSFLAPENPIRRIIEYSFSSPFIKLLKEERFDYLVSTHFLSNSIVSILKSHGHLDIKAISVVTDYTLHPFWVSKAVDTYIVSCDDVRQELIRRGIEDNRIKVIGIPAGEKFYKKLDRDTTAAKLGINPKEFTGLIITGAIGIGPIEEIVKALNSQMQLIVVCGRNKRLYKRLLGLSLDKVNPVRELPSLTVCADGGSKPPLALCGNNRRLKSAAFSNGVKVFPLIDNVDELMSVSDVVFTKAGGLTITESLVKSLPMIFFSSIPGLETSNADAVCKYGAGFKPQTIEQLKEAALMLKNNPQAYEYTQGKIDALAQKTTLQDLSTEIT